MVAWFRGFPGGLWFAGSTVGGMMSRSVVRWFVAVAWLATVPACALYGGADDDGANCDPGVGGPYEPAGLEARNPETGACETTGDNLGNACDSRDSVVGGGGEGAAPTPLDWGACTSYCDGLTELDCALADGCRAVYVAYPTDGPSGGVRAYAACWAIAPSGPQRGGVCEGLDAYSCSLRDDCSVVHDNVAGVPGTFASCITESACANTGPSGEPAPPPEYRNPDTGACESGTSGDPCGGFGVGGMGFPPVADWGMCGSPCEGYDEASCRAADGCRVILGKPCAAAEDCASAFSACWPTAPSGPIVGDVCDGLGAYDCSRHQDCAAEHALAVDGSLTTFFGCRIE